MQSLSSRKLKISRLRLHRGPESVAIGHEQDEAVHRSLEGCRHGSLSARQMQKDRLECLRPWPTRSPSLKQEKVGGSEQDQVVEAGLFYNARILASRGVQL